MFSQSVLTAFRRILRRSELNQTNQPPVEGKGSRLMIRVPLTLAIMPTLMVNVGDQPFALPLGSVSEIFDLEESRTNIVDGQLVVMVRERALPLFYLREWLVSGTPQQDVDVISHVVVVHVGSQKVGFVVEQLVGQEEVVIKTLEGVDSTASYVLGATITGDGKVVFILDVTGMSRNLLEITSKV